MKTLIVFASTHGFTGKCVHRLQQALPAPVSVVDLTRNPYPVIGLDDFIIVGGSLHLGHLQSSVQAFCDRYYEVLLAHAFALFLCCRRPDEEAADQFETAFPLRLRAFALSTALLGGTIPLDRSALAQRWIQAQVSGLNANTEVVDETALATFVAALRTAQVSTHPFAPGRN